MTAYTVQYVLPVDNPVNNVRLTRKKQVMIFEVPINYPDAHEMTLRQLIEASERSGLLGLSTHVNNKTGLQTSSTTIKRV